MGEPKADDSEPSPRVGRARSAWNLFAFSLAAAHFPGLFWAIEYSASCLWVVLLSPVMFLTFVFGPQGIFVAPFLLLLFWAAIGIASAASCEHKRAHVLLPATLFVNGMLQMWAAGRLSWWLG